MNPRRHQAIFRSLRRLAAFAALDISASVIGIFTACFALCGPASAGIITTDPNLPPSNGAYWTSHVTYNVLQPQPVVIDIFSVRHSGFTNVTRTTVGPNELENFNSSVFALLSVNGGPMTPVTLAGSVQTEVFGKTGNTLGTFATEMLQLNLTGGGIMIRESPLFLSTGSTTISNFLGQPGIFEINSFFDVFTDISLDSGLTWTASTGPAERVVLPEPESLALVALGLALLGWGKRRSRFESL